VAEKEARSKESEQERVELDFPSVKFLLIDLLIVTVIGGLIGASVYFAGICAM